MTTKQDALKIIGLYFLVMILVVPIQLFITPLLKEALEDQSFAITFNTGLNFLIYGLLTLLLVVIFKKIFKHDIRLSKENTSETVKLILIGFGIMIGFIIINGVIYQYLNITETSNNQAAIDTMFTNGRIIDWIFLIIFTVVFAPIVEEMIFRKAVMRFFQTTPLLAIFFSGAAFGFIHVTSGDYIQIIYYMSVGFVLAFFYYQSKYNVIVPIVMHMIFNGFLVSLMFLGL